MLDRCFAASMRAQFAVSSLIVMVIFTLPMSPPIHTVTV
jgi:hypothetical protein